MSEQSADHVTTAYHFIAAPAPSPLLPPATLLQIRELIAVWKKRLTLGYIAIDNQRVPYAAAVALCTDASEGIIGSLGGNRNAYFRILRHFHDDDFGSFFKEYVNIPNEGRIDYQHKPQWDDKFSPLRLTFLTDDPNRHEWGLGTIDGGACLVKGGFLPPLRTSLCAHTSWLNALTVMLGGQDHAVYPYFDEDGQLMMSGYALHAAGVIDDKLSPTRELTIEERREWRIGEPASEAAAMIVVLKLYAGFLMEALDRREGTVEAIAHLGDHMDQTVKWLIEHGGLEMKQVMMAAGSKMVN